MKYIKKGRPKTHYWRTGGEFQKEHKEFLGRSHTLETIEKMRESQKGLHPSPETEFKKGQFGEKSGQWKGGITPIHQAIRICFEYRQWRISIFQQDNYTCQKCGLRNGCGKAICLEAHHTKEFTILLAEFLQEYDQFSPYEDQHTLLRLATKWQPFWTAEGETLCRDCHKLTKKGRVR